MATSTIHEDSTSLLQSVSTSLDYKPCPNCVRHPYFLDILPVTLHRGVTCVICEKSCKEQIRNPTSKDSKAPA